MKKKKKWLKQLTFVKAHASGQHKWTRGLSSGFEMFWFLAHFQCKPLSFLFFFCFWFIAALCLRFSDSENTRVISCILSVKAAEILMTIKGCPASSDGRLFIRFLFFLFFQFFRGSAPLRSVKSEHSNSLLLRICSLRTVLSTKCAFALSVLLLHKFLELNIFAESWKNWSDICCVMDRDDEETRSRVLRASRNCAEPLQERLWTLCT